MPPKRKRADSTRGNPVRVPDSAPSDAPEAPQLSALPATTSVDPSTNLLLEKETKGLISCLTHATYTTSQILRLGVNIHRQKVGPLFGNIPPSFASQLGMQLERYDELCDTISQQIERARVVIQRDIDLEKARIEQERLATLQPATQALSSSSPTTLDLTSTQGSSAPKITFINDDGVIHIDSDSEEDIPLSRRQSTSHEVIDLTGDAALEQSSGTKRKKPRGPVGLRLDLSSEALRGVTVPAGQHSPVTLAPRTALPSAIASNFDGMFPPMSGNDLGQMLSVLTSSTGASVIDLDPSGGGIPDSSAASVIDLTKDEQMQMKELFGDDEDADADMEELFGASPAITTSLETQTQQPTASQLSAVSNTETSALPDSTDDTSFASASNDLLASSTGVLDGSALDPGATIFNSADLSAAGTLDDGLEMGNEGGAGNLDFSSILGENGTGAPLTTDFESIFNDMGGSSSWASM